MASDQFSLHWDNFHNNMSSGMNSLLENEDLVDVTLAVEGKCLKAHKVVLSVCSPYFKELFKNNPCQHPIVFMKDVSYVALSDLLQFMYQGEVQVSQDNLTSFIKTAEALQIKGLTGENNGSNDTEVEVEKNSIAPVVAPPPQPTPQQEFRTEYKPLQKQRKVLQSQSQPTPSPKRARLSSDNSQLMTPVTKTEQLAPISTSNEVVQFKMEPYDQNQSISIDETPDETFGDDNTLDEANVDDTEDYSMMEGGEEEPQAGTSAEGAGEGQGCIYFDVATKNPKIVLDDHDYLIYRKESTKTIWKCNHYFKQNRCKSTLVTTGRIVNVSADEHNHSPKPKKDKYKNMLCQNVTIIREGQFH
ncbi:protein tramtrack, beta isoform isoform X17 [Aethina tumida]|uniref:protein tramtrack, beta isoform isoform X17 n=1 Tax=Aethina tumida TaxID=116153 RepID=UPI00096B5ABB|nr:protein tramtrack, beta isoform isoform X17 [Aethina tumida]